MTYTVMLHIGGAETVKQKSVMDFIMCNNKFYYLYENRRGTGNDGYIGPQSNRSKS